MEREIEKLEEGKCESEREDMREGKERGIKGEREERESEKEKKKGLEGEGRGG